MNAPDPLLAETAPHTGANMDRVLPRSRNLRWLKPVLASVVAATLITIGWQAIPRGLAVKASELDIASVKAGQFRDELLLRAIATPFESVMLDAAEGGRVEAVEVRDGALLKKGELMFRLSNPQRQQEVLARASDVAQQVANVSTLRAALAMGRSEHRRRIADLEYQTERTRRTHVRNEQLARQGFLSAAALEESRDTLALQQRLLDEARADAATEDATRLTAIAEMDRAVSGLNAGLKLVRATADALAVRAPSDGRLTDFHLIVGTSVKPGERLGRIDSPDHFKLLAQVDEYYLARCAPGIAGTADIGGQAVDVKLTRVNPQIKERRFDIEIEFKTAASPRGLQPGLTIDTRLVLGQPSAALLLPDGSYYADSGGAWVFVVTPDGRAAERRNVRLGRRAAGQVEVLGGLARGERVIISSYQGFGDTRRLRLDS